MSLEGDGDIPKIDADAVQALKKALEVENPEDAYDRAVKSQERGANLIAGKVSSENLPQNPKSPEKKSGIDLTFNVGEVVKLDPKDITPEAVQGMLSDLSEASQKAEEELRRQAKSTPTASTETTPQPKELTITEVKQEFDRFWRGVEETIENQVRLALDGGALDEKGIKELKELLVTTYKAQFFRNLEREGKVWKPKDITVASPEPVVDPSAESEDEVEKVNIPIKQARTLRKKLDYLFWGAESREEYLDRVNREYPGLRLGDVLRERGEHGSAINADKLEQLLKYGYLYINDLSESEISKLKSAGKILDEYQLLDEEDWHRLEEQREKRAKQGSTASKLGWMLKKVFVDSWSPFKRKINEAGQKVGSEQKFYGLKNWGTYFLSIAGRLAINLTPYKWLKFGATGSTVLVSLAEAGVKVNDVMVRREIKKHGGDIDEVLSSIEANHNRFTTLAARSAVKLQQSSFGESLLKIFNHDTYKAVRAGMVAGTMGLGVYKGVDWVVDNVFDMMTNSSDSATQMTVDVAGGVAENTMETHHVASSIVSGGRGEMIPDMVDGKLSMVQGHSLPDGQSFVTPSQVGGTATNPIDRIVGSDSTFHQLLDFAKETVASAHELDLSNVHSWGEVTRSVHEYFQHAGIPNHWDGAYPEGLSHDWFKDHYVDIVTDKGVIEHNVVAFDVNWLYADMHTDVGQVLGIPMHEFSIPRLYEELAKYPEMQTKFLEILKEASLSHDAHAYTMNVNPKFHDFIDELNVVVNK